MALVIEFADILSRECDHDFGGGGGSSADLCPPLTPPPVQYVLLRFQDQNVCNIFKPQTPPRKHHLSSITFRASCRTAHVSHFTAFHKRLLPVFNPIMF
jgi:hypothetical protein